MPPERIDSLNVDSQKGLVLSLLKRIDELFEQNKGLLEQNNSLLARIDELLARIAELEGRGGKPPKTPSNSSLPPSALKRTEGQCRGQVRQEEEVPQRPPRRCARALSEP